MPADSAAGRVRASPGPPLFGSAGEPSTGPCRLSAERRRAYVVEVVRSGSSPMGSSATVVSAVTPDDSGRISGLDEMKEAVAELIARRGGPQYDPYGEIVITDGDGSAILNALLVLTDPGDEVILADPAYAGMLQRVRLVSAAPRLVPLRGDTSGWRLDLVALQAAVSDRTRMRFLPHEPRDSIRLGRERRGVEGDHDHLPRAKHHAPLLDALGGSPIRRAADRRPIRA